MIFKRYLSTTPRLLNSIYFGENSLNRLSFLRKDPVFIANALTSPYSKIIFFNNLNPIVDSNSLYISNYSQLGTRFSEILDSWITTNREHQSSPLLCHFMGLSNLHYSPFKYHSYSGTPYFAIELSTHPEIHSLLPTTLKELITREEINQHLNNHDASIYAQGKMYLHWLQTTKYCRGCGSQTIPINAGSELTCSSSNSSCPVQEAPVSNASFPRLDPVLITCVIHKDYILFTRNQKFPKGMYTCIAGFIEPGESIENAVKREVWEESGLEVDDVKIVQSQPWPFPTNIMIGCIAVVKENSVLNLGHDDELQDAMWIHKDNLNELVYKGVENEDSIITTSSLPYGIPNDKTLAYQLYKHSVDHIFF